MSERRKYKFIGRSNDGNAYIWQSGRIPGDSRAEEIRCNVSWFWDHGCPPVSYDRSPVVAVEGNQPT